MGRIKLSHIIQKYLAEDPNHTDKFEMKKKWSLFKDTWKLIEFFLNLECKKLLVNLGCSMVQVLNQKICCNSHWTHSHSVTCHLRNIVIQIKHSLYLLSDEDKDDSLAGILSPWALYSIWHTELPWEITQAHEAWPAFPFFLASLLLQWGVLSKAFLLSLLQWHWGR